MHIPVVPLGMISNVSTLCRQYSIYRINQSATRHSPRLFLSIPSETENTCDKELNAELTSLRFEVWFANAAMVGFFVKLVSQIKSERQEIPSI